MDSPDAVTRGPRAGRIAVVAVLALLVLAVLTGRWLSPNLLLGTRTTELSCRDGLCVEQVRRGETLILAPYDRIRVGVRGGARAYVADNPFGDSPLTVEWAGGGVRITDGTATLSWDAAVLARLGD
ncbi:hypothetical protein [Catenuloplanes atrovinosus]|uniref:Uncharacterized protein n=1 Tax=Catenuloplanes atrovinosus TaxID=137266 RepID=A0AAE3YKK8_9ACTN|nr:hypothetical protein [Catenuloplanes atrovinosus]MDR7275543.1 hypothetical protein [Catenuloplanes atrovinosus]